MRKAVIDMGTNSTRLAIGEQGNGTVQIVYTQVAETRLGEGMGTERIIQPEPLKIFVLQLPVLCVMRRIR